MAQPFRSLKFTRCGDVQYTSYNSYVETNRINTVEMTRIKVGKRQTIETLINEEVLLFANFLKGERETWIPRITSI
jgi:hypothetical protein